MRQISCPVCNTNPSRFPAANQLIYCSNCAVGWTYLPIAIDSEALYQDEVYEVVDNRKSIFERVIFFEANRILTTSKKLSPNSKSLLDFGAGKGQFLFVAKTKGWQGLGIETESNRADFAVRNYQVKVLSYFYSGGKIEGAPFDFITLNHVLEHLPKPITLVQELLRANLKTGGVAYLEVPRENSWQAKIAGDRWMHWDIPKHLTHWNEEVLLNEMGKIGFSKIADRRFSIHLGVMGMVQALLSIFGFQDNLVLRLKRKKSIGLVLGIGLILPVAICLEAAAVLFNRSGILGVYVKSNG